MSLFDTGASYNADKCANISIIEATNFDTCNTLQVVNGPKVMHGHIKQTEDKVVGKPFHQSCVR